MGWIWIVGASSGIGHGLAQEYAKQGACIVISARNEIALNELKQRCLDLGASDVLVAPLDINDDSQVTGAVDIVTQRLKTEDHLEKVVINSGVCEYVDQYPIELELMHRVMNTNFYGAVRMTNAVLPLLELAAGQSVKPQLVFVGSSVSYQALPRAHAYGASKAALRYFAECLKMDLQKQGIDVRVVSPGFVKTPLTDLNDFDMPFIVTVEEAAQRIRRGLESSSFDVAFPKRFTWMLKLFSWLPNAIKFSLLSKMSRHDPASSEQIGGKS